jgi:hypothetical protein
MKKMLLLFSSLLFCCSVEAQNLVPNYSFEDTVACPTSVDEVYNCTYWSSFGNSSDYYNACASSIVNVPNTLFGYQQASFGNAYCGLYSYETMPFYREYIGSQLISPLQTGVKYFASFKANLADNIGHNCKSSKIGMLLSTVPYNAANPPSTNNFAHVFSQALISDSINWQTVTGSFIADSNYQYIVIGNFFDNAHTDTLDCLGGAWSSYLYVDDICVSTDSLTCNPKEGVGIQEILNPNSEIKIYPNPFHSTFTLHTPSTLLHSSITICNSFGEIVHQQIITSTNQQIDLEVGAGVYFLSVASSASATEVQKLIVY